MDSAGLSARPDRAAAGRVARGGSPSSLSLAAPGRRAGVAALPGAGRQAGTIHRAASSSSSSRSCSSSCSGWCTSCRRRSRTSATIRSSRPSGRCACCRWCSAACSGRSRGCGRIRSRSCTRWPTAPTRPIRTHVQRARAWAGEQAWRRLRDRLARLEERAFRRPSSRLFAPISTRSKRSSPTDEVR